jgi:hypothetical protein
VKYSTFAPIEELINLTQWLAISKEQWFSSLSAPLSWATVNKATQLRLLTHASNLSSHLHPFHSIALHCIDGERDKIERKTIETPR